MPKGIVRLIDPNGAITEAEAGGRTSRVSISSDSLGLSEPSQVRICNQLITVTSQDAPQFIDITDLVSEIIADSGIASGNVLVYSTHTTCSIIINEHEPLLLKDMAHFLERQAPKADYYGHNDFAIRTVSVRPNECPNGHSHCQHLVLGTSETVPIVDGAMLIGEFQRLFLVELDEPKPRHIFVQVMGI